MNYKQKLGYTFLGAGIMALGIIIGQWGTPDIKAQNIKTQDIDWFEKIRCREIQVMDKDGNTAIELHADELDSGITIFDKQGNRVIFLNVDELTGSGVSVSDPQKSGEILLRVDEKIGSDLRITSKHREGAIRLSSRKEGNKLSIFDKAGHVIWQAP